MKGPGGMSLTRGSVRGRGDMADARLTTTGQDTWRAAAQPLLHGERREGKGRSHRTPAPGRGCEKRQVT